MVKKVIFVFNLYIVVNMMSYIFKDLTGQSTLTDSQSNVLYCQNRTEHNLFLDDTKYKILNSPITYVRICKHITVKCTYKQSHYTIHITCVLIVMTISKRDSQSYIKR
jgi:hypothetical protein